MSSKRVWSSSTRTWKVPYLRVLSGQNSFSTCQPILWPFLIASQNLQPQNKQTNKNTLSVQSLWSFFPFWFREILYGSSQILWDFNNSSGVSKGFGAFFPPEVYFRSIGFALQIALCWIIHIYQTLLWSQISISDRCVSVFMVHALTITI